MRSPGLACLIAVAVALCWTTVAAAAVCTVPSAPHPTIQEAVDDVGCTEIVIAAGAYVESVSIDRSLSVAGASTATTIVEGRFDVTGAATAVSLNDSVEDVGWFTSIAIGIDGIGLISYNDSTNQNLKVVHLPFGYW